MNPPLSASTLRDNARFFARIQDVPTEAVTQGIGTVVSGRSTRERAAETVPNLSTHEPVRMPNV